MPRVTVNINAPSSALDQELLPLELPDAATVKDLKSMIENGTGFPSQNQHLFLNGRPLTADTQTLDEAGVKDGEMLAVLIRERGTGPAAPARTGDPRSSNARRGAHDPENVRQHILNDPAAQDQLRQSKPELLAALNDPQAWREAYTMAQQQEQEAEHDRQKQIALLNDDPFNIDAQRKIEEIIRQDRVIENLQHAYEHNPEVFARVHMLYINTEVNGHPVKAFVDSGAQATIMSPKCAEQCGIKRLIDTRYAGIAKGVGTARILGRVHHSEIKIGGAVMPCAFTVMEGKDVDLLFGLDMLKRYKAKIDLDKNVLAFEGLEVPFLPEHEIPKFLDDAELNEPTVAGPNGTEIGARSGAVRPAGTTQGAEPTTSAGPSSSAPAPQGPAEPTDSFPAEHIEQLINLGFSRQAAIQALRATGGNVDLAASLLFQ